MLKISKLVALIFFVTTLYVAPAFAATSIPFTITMSKAVNVTGIPRIALDVGGVTRYATYTSGSGTSALTFAYSMVAGDVDLDGVTVSSPIDLNGGTIKDLAGNDLTPLTFTAPNTSNVKVNYPSLGMDFVYDADGRYTLNGTVYNDLTSFLSAAGGTFTRASVGTYFDSTGTLQTAASDTPRFDYDPVTHTAKGILIEESKTNLIKYSEDFANGSSWFNTQISVTSNAATSPAGTTTAELLTRTGTSGGVYQQQLYSGGTGSYTASIFAKAATTGNQFGLRIQGTFPDRGDAKFNLTTGVVIGALALGNYTNASATIKHVGNGWYRLTLTITANVSSVSRVVFGPADSSSYYDSWESGSATLSNAYVWGAQLEQGVFSTSYTPTTTAAVTRAADVLSIPTGSWVNATKGTLLGIAQQTILVSAHPTYIATIGNNSSSNFVATFLNAASGKSAVVNTAGADQYNQLAGAYIAGNTSKIGLAYQANDFIASMDGTFATAGSSGTIPSVSVLRIGDRDGTRTFNGAIQMFKYYPARVANTQLQLMTQ